MKTSEQINEIAKSMCAAQGQMKPAQKDAINPHYKSKYSDISSVWEAMRIPLSSNLITVWQDVTTEEAKISVVTRLIHASGQWVEFGPLSIPLSKKDAHGIGSAISYAKRYALCAAVGVVSGDEDDDANEAVKKSNDHQMKEKPVEVISKHKVDDFNKRYNLGSNNDYDKYINAICSKCGKSKDEIINSAVQNEIGFAEAFGKWKSSLPSNEIKEASM